MPTGVIERMLDGKVAVVTGAGQGLGKAFALSLAEHGAKVVVADINLSTANDVAKIIREEKNATGIALQVDVTNEKDTVRMAEQAAEKFGNIDILVNNAAIYYGIQRKPFFEITEQEWDRMLDVNLKGTWLCCKAVFPYMKKQGRGKIVNMASGVVFSGTPNFLHYVSSKGAVLAFTRALAKEVGKYGINVNSISPGLTMTTASELQSTPEHLAAVVKSRAIPRLENAEDLVGAMLFLASDQSDFVTGQSLVVDGGAIFH